MTKEQKLQNLVHKVRFLCEKLNEIGFLERIPNNEGGFDNKYWVVDTQYPNATFLGGICGNKNAFSFLKQNGYLDRGICWECGEEPISNKNTFSDGSDSSIHFFICDSCFNKGLNHQKALGIDKNSNCYIATVCYGDINALEVQCLRQHRDQILLKTRTGRLFINLYYIVSPYLAEKLKHRKYLNNFIRIYLLDKIVKTIRNNNKL